MDQTTNTINRTLHHNHSQCKTTTPASQHQSPASLSRETHRTTGTIDRTLHHNHPPMKSNHTSQQQPMTTKNRKGPRHTHHHQHQPAANESKKKRTDQQPPVPHVRSGDLHGRERRPMPQGDGSVPARSCGSDPAGGYRYPKKIKFRREKAWRLAGMAETGNGTRNLRSNSHDGAAIPAYSSETVSRLGSVRP